LAVANANADYVAILNGLGDGTFTTALFLDAGRCPSDVCVADIDENNDADLVVANGGSNDLSVFLADGFGGFAAQRRIDARNYGPESLVAAHIDADSHVDLAVANYGPSTVSIFRGDGTGAFTGIANVPTGRHPRRVIAADFDRDGMLDLASANDIGTVTVLLGNGAAGFSPPHDNTIYGLTSSLSFADFDEDGLLDVALVDRTVAASLAVYHGDGIGGFTGPSLTPIDSSFPYASTAADFDEDGHLDVAFTAQSSGVTVLRGDGSGRFSQAHSFAVDLGPFGIATADLDGDGHVDLVTSNGNEAVSVFLGDGTGAFALGLDFGVGGEPGSIRIGDLDGDGLSDIVVTDCFTNDLAVLHGRTMTCRTRCIRGNVGAGAAAIVPVLRVDGSTGGSDGLVVARLRSPIDVSLRAAPAGPSRANYVLWMWGVCPSLATELLVSGVSLGCTVGPTPLQAALSPQPTRCLRGSGMPAAVCAGTRDMPSTPRHAPWTLRFGGGSPGPVIVTMQAVLQDLGAANPRRYSVTNAVTLQIR
ncbi:MAG: VCBS repeat-containing protein, partial [Planctomycetes bacterium]|nr:VCBS repeat-containing protein [Planctomycetota bacterium]